MATANKKISLHADGRIWISTAEGKLVGKGRIELMKKIINSNSGVIVLSSPLILTSSENKKDRAELFVEIFRDAALYNILPSFYKTISQDTGLFNSIASFFRK